MRTTDNNMAELAALCSEAKELLRIALQCRVGAEGLVRTSSQDLPLLVQLKRDKQRMLGEFVDTTVELRLREQLISEPLADVSISEHSIEELGESNHCLEEDLLSVKLQYHRDYKLLECLQTSKCLLEQLFPSNPDQPKDSYVCSLVDRHTHLNTELLKAIESLRKVESEVEKVRKERAVKQHECRQLMKLLEDTEQKDKELSSDSHSDQSRLDQLSAEATILRHTLQSLIMGSGANWSKGDLLDLMLSLGNRFEWQ